MEARTVRLTVAVLVLGTAGARLLLLPGSPRPPPRRVPAPAPGRERPVPPQPAPDAAPRVDPAQRLAVSRLEPGQGRLVVDFSGVPSDEVAFYLWGAPRDARPHAVASTPVLACPTEAMQDLPPGRYRPFWRVAGRYGLYCRDVRVEEGKVTRVPAGIDGAQELPLLPGTARVNAQVFAATGASVAGIGFSLASGGLPIPARTDRTGRCTLDLPSGDVVLLAGNSRVPLSLRDGEWVAHLEIRPTATGDLALDLPPGCSDGFWLRRDGTRWTTDHAPCLVAGPPPRHWSHLAPGRYDVCWPGPYGIGPAIGQAWVEAGRETRFTGPPGGVEISCGCGEAHECAAGIRLSAAVRGVWSEVLFCAVSSTEDRRILTIPWLAPGRYRLEVSVHVRDHVVELAIHDSVVPYVVPFPE